MRYLSAFLFAFLSFSFVCHACPSITLSGYGEGTGAIIAADAKLVQSLIPNGLELVPLAENPSGTHPVMLLYATQKNLSLIERREVIPLAKEYKEIIFLVQNVRLKGGKKIYSYFKKLYLDNVAAIVGGWYLSYPKSYAHFDFQDGFYSTLDILGRSLIDVKFTVKQDYDQKEFSQKILDLQNSLQDVVADKFGKLECSHFTYDMKNAITAPIYSQWHVTTKFNKIFAGDYNLTSLDESSTGGFLLSAPWVLTGPVACE